METHNPKWMQTANGDDIKPGLMVWTYDWKWGKVNKDDFERRMQRNDEYATRYLRQYGPPVDGSYVLRRDDFWFRVDYPDGSSNIYNDQRLITICPNCHGDFEGCNNSGCGGRKEPNWAGWKK